VSFDSNDSVYKLFSNRRERGERQMHVIGKGKDREGRGRRGGRATFEIEFWVHDPQPKTVEVMSPKLHVAGIREASGHDT